MLNLLITISWIAFWLYWFGVATIKNKPALAQHRSNKSQRLVLFLVVAAIFIFDSHSFILSKKVAPHDPLVKIVGVFIFYAGLVLAVWARNVIGSSWAMAGTIQKQPKLVTAGPYKMIRHPIYSGILLATLGSFLIQSYEWLAIFAAAAFIFTLSAYKEEKALAQQLPNQYPAYKKRTKMLIPYIF